jgi:hypothetical protein
MNARSATRAIEHPRFEAPIRRYSPRTAVQHQKLLAQTKVLRNQ